MAKHSGVNGGAIGARLAHDDLLAAVGAETDAQIEKWGVQNHRAVHSENARRGFAQAAERYKALNDARVSDGSLAWDGILLEEVFEALECTDPAAMVAELIQLAAVAVSMAASVERNLPTDPEPEPAEVAEAA